MQSVHNNYCKIYHFDNGWGASVVCNEHSMGNKSSLFEVAVLDSYGELCYTSPISDDVIGYLCFEGVAKVLRQIQDLERVQ